MNLKQLPKIASSLLCLFYFACKSGDNNKQQETEQINKWYNAIVAKRYQDNDSIDYYALKIDSASKKLPAQYKAMAHIGMGLFYSKKTFFQKALSEYNIASSLLEKTNVDSLKAKTYTGIGGAYKNTGKFPEAIDNYLLALRIFEKEKNIDAIAGIHSNIGQIHQVKGEMEIATQHVKEAMNLLEKDKTKSQYLIALHTLANLYGMSGKFDSALVVDAQGISLTEQIKSNALKSTFLDNKANCFTGMKQYDSAAYYFQQCLEIDSSFGNRKQMSDTYLNLGELKLTEKKYVESEQKLSRSITLAKEVGYSPGLQHAWAFLAKVYYASNAFEKALQAKDSAAAYRDSTINEKSQSRMAELREVYDSEKKEQTILLQDSKLSKQKILTIGLIVLLLLAALLSYLFYKRFKLKKEKQLQEKLHQQQQQATIDILTAEEKERKRIASDLHDGVGQLMTAAWLNLQAANEQIKNENNERSHLISKTLELVDESCREVRAVSHNMMPNALLKKGLVNAVREFVQQINVKQTQINVQTDGLNKSLPDFVEAVLYRIIQESVNNVVKHAQASKLDINISQDEELISIMIEDNGKGFNVTDALKKEGIGLQNIRSRVQYLKGTVEWSSSDTKGTLVAIHIPVKQ